VVRRFAHFFLSERLASIQKSSHKGHKETKDTNIPLCDLLFLCVLCESSSSKQFFQFVNKLAEYGAGGVYGGRVAHVYSGGFQRLNREA